MKSLALACLLWLWSSGSSAYRTLRAGGSHKEGSQESWEGGERLLCKLGPRPGFNASVQVWVDARENTRGLAFSGDGLGEQTLVRCTGSLDDACAQIQQKRDVDNFLAADPPAPDCAGIQCPCQADTSDVQFGYMRRMMDQLAPRCTQSEGRMKVLLVGLGGGALVNLLLANCPAAQVEAVEYDPRVVDVATRFFGVETKGGRAVVETGDGGSYVASQASGNPGEYDAVLIDCFQAGGEVPESCSSDAFIQNLSKILRGGGLALQQIWSPQYAKVLKRYKELLGDENVRGLDVDLGLNHLIITSKPQSGV